MAISIFLHDHANSVTTGSQSRKISRIHKRPSSCLADTTSGYLQMDEERRLQPKQPRIGLDQQSSSYQAIPRSLRPVSDHSLDNAKGLRILYSGQLHKQQMRTPVFNIDDDAIDDGNDDSNSARSDLLFQFDHVNNAASDRGFPAGLNVEDFMSDEEFQGYMADQQELRQHHQIWDAKSLVPSVAGRPARIAINKHDHHGQQLGIGVTVELNNGDFIKITDLQQDTFSMIIFLRGRLFRRMRFLGGTIEKKINELCLIQDINQADARSHREQALKEVDVKYVKRRRGLRITNKPFPELSFREEGSIYKQSVVTDDGVLVCRWKYIRFFLNERALQRNAHCEKALIYLRSGEANEKWCVNDEVLRQNFRGDAIKGGASPTLRTADSAQIYEEQDVASKAAYRSAEFTPETGSPGSSFALPINVDFDFSRMSLEPPELRPGSRKRGTETTNSTHNANPEGGLFGRQMPRDPPSLSNRSAIDLTSDNDDNNSRQVIQIKSNRGYEQNDCRYRDRRDHPMSIDTPLRQQATIGADTWDVKNGFFVQKTTKSRTSPRSDSLSDSDSTAIGDENLTIVNLEEVQEVPRLYSSIGSIEKQNKPPVRAQSSSFNRSNMVNSRRTGRSLQRYTFGDGFCGCGGVSRGATMAGLSLQWAFDFEEPMCLSYKRNFRAPHVYWSDAFDFATGQITNTKVDVLHLSPPCQFFSPAHTTAGTYDERNTATSFVIGELLKKAKPRIVTLENTLGLEQRHPLYLHAVIQQFTVLGFSIRWKTIDLRDYGVPQSRRRLIIIAAW